jgi:plasmid segregation protein ParM
VLVFQHQHDPNLTRWQTRSPTASQADAIVAQPGTVVNQTANRSVARGIGWPFFDFRRIAVVKGDEIMNLGIDLGYSAVKLVAGQRRVTFPSLVGTPELGRFSLDGQDQNIILTAPVHALVGEGAMIQSRFVNRREDRAWIESGEYYHLFLAALTELSTATVVDLLLVTGLPVAFYGDKGILKDRILGVHKVSRVGRHAQTFKVSDCRVIPQPFGSLLAAALDDRGRIADQKLATGSVGVIDIGGKTTNLLSVERLAEIGRQTESVSVGAWDVVRAVRAFLTDRCPNLELRDHQVIQAMIAREVQYYGQPVDLGPVVDAAMEPMANQVIAQASQLWNGGAALDAILVAGGGAFLLAPRLKSHFPHARVVADPVFANAEGYWKLAQRLGSSKD